MRALALLLLATTHAVAQPCPFPGQTPHLVVQLFFGQSISAPTQGGQAPGLVSRRAWQRFVADTITPALPRGFTMLDATGQYADPRTGAIGREPTELVIVAAPDSPAFRTAITGIVEAYRRRFAQHAVGLVSHDGCAAF